MNVRFDLDQEGREHAGENCKLWLTAGTSTASEPHFQGRRSKPATEHRDGHRARGSLQEIHTKDRIIVATFDNTNSAYDAASAIGRFHQDCDFTKME